MSRRPRRRRTPAWDLIVAVAAAALLAALPFAAKLRELSAGVSPLARHLEWHLGLAEREPVLGGLLRFFCPLCGKDLLLPEVSTAAARRISAGLRLEAGQFQPALLASTATARARTGP
jgi:hypothetical protein